MSGQLEADNAPKKIAIKRKRAPVWPLATRPVLESATTTLVERGIIREMHVTDQASRWRIHPSTESRGKGFQHERKVLRCDASGQWTQVKLRQHCQDPTSSADRTGFEGGDIAWLNIELVQTLKNAARGGGGRPGHGPVSTTTAEPGRSAAGPEVVGPVFGIRDVTEPVEDCDIIISKSSSSHDIQTCDKSSHASADRDEEEAAARELNRVAEVIGPTVNTAPRPQLDSWTEYLERPITWINYGPSSSRPLSGAVVQWFSFTT
jgi:hypothetical protein